MENSSLGGFCNRSNEDLVPDEVMEVEIEKKALMDILRELKKKGTVIYLGYFMHHFLGGLWLQPQIISFNQKGCAMHRVYYLI